MITSYATLKQAVADWLARADLTSQIPTFIQLAEARMSRDLVVREMQFSETGTASSLQIPYPDNCRTVQSLRISTGGTYTEIHPLPVERLADTTNTSFPSGYVVVQDVIKLIGGSGSPSYAMTYTQSVPSLTDTITTNWLLSREPGLYLYATLLEASPYIQDDSRALVWAQQYQSILGGINAEDERARFGNAPSIQRPVRYAP